MNHTNRIYLCKHIIYVLLLLFFYVLQTTPGLLVIAGIKPLFLVPLAVAIAMFEGEFIGGLYGAVAGLLCDVAGSSLFGFNGLFIAMFCIAAGLLVIYLLRANLLGYILFVAVTLLVRGSIEFLFAYGMWGYDNVWKLYTFYTLPTILYTLLFTPLIFFLIRSLYHKFAKAI